MYPISLSSDMKPFNTSVCLQMDDVYLLGGNDGKDWLDVVEVYTPARDTWRDVPPMPMERGYGASVSLDGSIYVMGGGNGAAWLDSMIRLDSQQNWHLVLLKLHRSVQLSKHFTKFVI